MRDERARAETVRRDEAPPPVLYRGSWQRALKSVHHVDAIITDPPYGKSVHEAYGEDSNLVSGRRDGAKARSIDYECWTPAQARRFVAQLSPKCRGWFVVMTSHDLVNAYSDALERAGRYVFAPLPFVAVGSRVRMCGDGPSSWTDWIIVARPRSPKYVKWGTLPGAYIVPPGHSERGEKDLVGGKPVWLMRALVRDYSKPGDLVCDPCAGAATTLIAAAIEGRRAVGAEVDKETHRRALERIGRGYTPDLFAGLEARRLKSTRYKSIDGSARPHGTRSRYVAGCSL